MPVDMCAPSLGCPGENGHDNLIVEILRNLDHVKGKWSIDSLTWCDFCSCLLVLPGTFLGSTLTFFFLAPA